MSIEENNNRTPLDDALDFYAEHVNVQARSKELALLESRFKQALKVLTEAEQAIRDLAETRLPNLFFGRSLVEHNDFLTSHCLRLAEIPPDSDIPGRHWLRADDLRSRIADLNQWKRMYGGLRPKKDPERNAIRLIYDTLCIMSEIIARNTGTTRAKVSHQDVADAINDRFGYDPEQGGLTANAVTQALKRTQKGKRR